MPPGGRQHISRGHPLAGLEAGMRRHLRRPSTEAHGGGHRDRAAGGAPDRQDRVGVNLRAHVDHRLGAGRQRDAVHRIAHGAPSHPPWASSAKASAHPASTARRSSVRRGRASGASRASRISPTLPPLACARTVPLRRGVPSDAPPVSSTSRSACAPRGSGTTTTCPARTSTRSSPQPARRTRTRIAVEPLRPPRVTTAVPSATIASPAIAA